MRIYISADMEGITGLVDADDVQPGGRDYERGRTMMTEDVNAAVRGALTAGATTVTVNDAHGPMRNLLPDALHPAARLVRGKPKLMSMLEGLDATYDAMVCIGFHSRAGTLGVLSHSFMGHEIEDMWLDDRPVGEIGFTHATAAALGVPVVMLSGDDAGCAEMTDWDPSVTCVAVKYANDRFAADLSPVAEARQAIETAVADSLTTRPAAVTPSSHTATLAVRWQSASVAATLLGIPGVTSADSRTVQASGTLPDLYRQFGVWTRVATALTHQAPYC
ncbi:M55 family metallopeptidase [Streptomyces caniferus]|uniref:M55 family metallopeptidase n=1 Tax=Streptomyces caniferus TaxID=285557 RepID=UPI0037FC96E7